MSHRLAILVVFVLINSSSLNVPYSKKLNATDESAWFEEYDEDSDSPEIITNTSIFTSLHSNWHSTLLLAEASEFVAAEYPHLLEPFIETVNRDAGNLTWEKLSDKRKYEYTIRTASRILPKCSLKYLKFVLALRKFSPRIQSYQMIAEKYGCSNCEVFIVLNGMTSCDYKEIRLRFIDENSVSSGQVRLKNATYNVTLYGELGTVTFSNVFELLKTWSDTYRGQLVVRHHSNKTKPSYVSLSAYGVELKIESGQLVDSDNKEFPFLEKEQFRNISYPAMYAMLGGRACPLQTLASYSESFPKAARSLADLLPTDESSSKLFDFITEQMRKEMLANRIALKEIGVYEGECSLYINGIKIDMKNFDVFNLADVLRKEEKIVDELYKIGARNETSLLFTKLNFSAKKKVRRPKSAYDYRRAKPFFFNDLETGDKSRNFQRSYQRFVKYQNVTKINRNLFNLVFVIDPTTREGYLMMKKCIFFYTKIIAIRVGVVLVVNDDPLATAENDVSVAVYTLWNHFYQSFSVEEALEFFFNFLSKHDGKLSIESVKSYWESILPANQNDTFDSVFAAGSIYTKGRKAGAELLRNMQMTRESLNKKPTVLLNGVLLTNEIKEQDSEFQLIFSEEINHLISHFIGIKKAIEQALKNGTLTEEMDAEKWVLEHNKVGSEMNNVMWEAANAQNYIDLSGSEPCMKNITLDEVEKLSKPDKARCLLDTISYVQNNNIVDTVPVTIWVVADVETEDGLRLVQSAVQIIETSNKTRVGIILNPSDIESAIDQESMSFYIRSALENKTMEESRFWLLNLTNKEFFEEFQQSENSSNFIEFDDEIIFDRIAIESHLATEVLGIKKGQRMVVGNGLKIGPLDFDDDFDLEDFQFFETELISRGAAKIPSLLKKWEVDTRYGAGSNAVVSIISFMKNYGLPRQRIWPKLAKTNHSVAIVHPNKTNQGFIDVIATVDPVLLEGQMLGEVLKTITNFANSHIRIVWNPNDTLHELAIQKRYYKYAIRYELEFDENENLTPFYVNFKSLPKTQVLSMSIQAPKSWIVEVDYTKNASIVTDFDLRNIQMKEMKADLVAVFSLKHLLVEGYCKQSNVTSSNPPLGLHLNLGTEDKPKQSQTTVINDGYFQLKANPGEWKLKIGEGRSSESYSLRDQCGDEDMENNTIPIFIDSFFENGVSVEVVKKIGAKELNETEQAQYRQVIHTFRTINVFSIASGHFEERFLRVMISSVKNNTKHPVKFWFLENSLSVQGKRSIRKMAEYHKFEYEMVSYKWPNWMNPERETKRFLERYKILFIDLIFPLDVERVIVLSPFTIVRTDIINLMDYDMEDSAYAFIPVWNEEGDYVDSSFFLIDLPKFRQLGLGDRRRRKHMGYNVANMPVRGDATLRLPEEWLRNHENLNETSPRVIDLRGKNNNKPAVEIAQKLADWKLFDSDIECNFISCIC